MPRTQKIITPKGQRYPGSGTPKGYVKPVGIEARALAVEMVNDALYQQRLRRDFALRKLHPTIESLVWAYAIGKPRTDINVTGSIDINARLEEEKRIFLQLDLPELEALQAKSQALIDEARMLAAARTGETIEGTFAPQNEEPEAKGAETLRISHGSDNTSCVNQTEPSDDIPITPDDSAG